MSERVNETAISTLTDEQVESEISRLLSNPDVKLAKEEQKIRNRRRQYLYQLRWLKKRGAALRAQGINEDTLHMAESGAEESEECDYGA